MNTGIILLIISFVLVVARANNIIFSIVIVIGFFLIFYALFRLANRKKWIVSSNNDSIQLSEISGISKLIRLDDIKKFYFGGASESSKSILKLYLRNGKNIRLSGDLFESDIKQLYQFLKEYSEANPILKEVESPTKLTAQRVIGVMLGAPLFMLLYLLIKEIFVK
ncbi:hypothetical protein EHQ52_15490 [Leptospira koniambonensis]|uniref:PH domain-containing protein n=1 Tax=Leptospira koniambonensis TaxID=2484950 RepID=A0A4R9J2W6_9LEPT|nr:hypothetical protein [Leptospira koniambonensis]TGL31339.1 hypothetical protein EHQ52_15490 [Leptospira koniambonensis]